MNAFSYVQHWNVASNHGRTIAHLLATGESKPYDKVAVFWSAQGQQLRYAGTSKASQWDDIEVQGNPDDLNFVAYYFGEFLSFSHSICENEALMNDVR